MAFACVALVSAQFGGGSLTRGSPWYQDEVNFVLSDQLCDACLLWDVELV